MARKCTLILLALVVALAGSGCANCGLRQMGSDHPAECR